MRQYFPRLTPGRSALFARTTGTDRSRTARTGDGSGVVSRMWWFRAASTIKDCTCGAPSDMIAFECGDFEIFFACVSAKYRMITPSLHSVAPSSVPGGEGFDRSSPRRDDVSRVSQASGERISRALRSKDEPSSMYRRQFSSSPAPRQEYVSYTGQLSMPDVALHSW